MRGGSVAAVLFVTIGSVSVALPATAETNDGTARAAARRLGYEGVTAYEAEHYDVASEKLERAFAVLQVPSLGLWSARALVKQDKLLEAVERYLQTSRLTVSGGDVAVQKRAQADAVTEADSTQTLIPSIVIRVDGAAAADVTLQVDGLAVSSRLIGDAMPVNPGAHRVEASRGTETVHSDVTVQRKEQTQVLLKFQGTMASAPTTSANAVVPTVAEPAPASDAQQRSPYAGMGGAGRRYRRAGGGRSDRGHSREQTQLARQE
jgi:hypothetical protein